MYPDSNKLLNAEGDVGFLAVRTDTGRCLQRNSVMKTTNSTSEIIALAWADDVSFDKIKRDTGLAEADVIRLMRGNLKPGSFKAWRARVSGRKAKHEGKMRTAQLRGQPVG
jgi:uncharacterized protein (TIGR03643 family)